MTEPTVTDTIKTYVDGVSANNPARVASVFRDDARLWGYLGGVEMVAMPVSAFLEVVANAPAPPTWVGGYTSRIRAVDVTGDVASAVLEETGYLGADFTNYFSLARVHGAWQIVSKVFFLTGGSLPA